MAISKKAAITWSTEPTRVGRAIVNEFRTASDLKHSLYSIAMSIQINGDGKIMLSADCTTDFLSGRQTLASARNIVIPDDCNLSAEWLSAAGAEEGTVFGDFVRLSQWHVALQRAVEELAFGKEHSVAPLLGYVSLMSTASATGARGRNSIDEQINGEKIIAHAYQMCQSGMSPRQAAHTLIMGLLQMAQDAQVPYVRIHQLTEITMENLEAILAPGNTPT